MINNHKPGGSVSIRFRSGRKIRLTLDGRAAVSQIYRQIVAQALLVAQYQTGNTGQIHNLAQGGRGGQLHEGQADGKNGALGPVRFAL